MLSNSRDNRQSQFEGHALNNQLKWRMTAVQAESDKVEGNKDGGGVALGTR